MANEYTTSTTSSVADFMTQLASFVVTTMGWTGETVTGGTVTNGVDLAAGVAGWSIAAAGTNTNDIQVAFQWDTASPNNLGIYQYNHASGAGNFNNANAPYAQATDSGSGQQTTTDSSLDDARYVELTSAPLQFWAFASSTPAKYVYVVVEISAGEYRHFGFGELLKFNDWDGGAFAYGWKHNTSASNMAVQATSYYLLDGYFRQTAQQDHMATINVENLPNQVASGMWAAVGSVEQHYQYSTGNDRQTSPIARAIMQGGFRQGLGSMYYGPFPASPISGMVPGYPILLTYVDTSLSVDDWYGPMGVMDGVRGVNIDQFAPAEDVTIGSVDWTIFPIKQKSGDSTSGGTGNAGIMYRKNVV